MNITFPDTLLMQNGGPVINIKRPPEPGMHAAKGDGVSDDTAAFLDVWDLLKREYKAHGPWGSDNSFYVYLPDGTYKVSDTLIYRGPTVGAYPKWDGTFDINHVHFVGQDRGKTIIKLADHCAGYQDPARPKIVLAFQQRGSSASRSGRATGRVGTASGSSRGPSKATTPTSRCRAFRTASATR